MSDSKAGDSSRSRGGEASERRPRRRARPDRGGSRSERRRASGAHLALAPPPELRHPAFLLAALVAAICIAVSVSFILYDTDMWQHLAVGRAIWTLRQVPTRELWTWPTYGAPDVNASWGFRFLIWPIWRAFGVWGLFAWRWASTLAAFGLMWAAARKMGARGLVALPVLVLCSLVYRQRSQVRPETLVSVLLAAEIWILESWRSDSGAPRLARGTGASQSAAPVSETPRDRRLWLVLISLLWANAHISYWLGLAVQGIYLVAGRGATSGSRVPRPIAPLLERFGLRGWRAPAAILLGSALISFLNPWGWAALWQPFEYFLHWRHEAIFQMIGELQPINWYFNRQNGLPILTVGWIALMLWRGRRRGLDLVEVLLFLLLAAIAFPTQRFLGFFALVAVPFVSRDLDAWMRSRAWRGSRGDVVTPGESAVDPRRGLWIRAALTAATCVVIGIPEWSRYSMPLGVAIDYRVPPIRACDFMETHGVRGRGFNQFAAGGYMIYRFWPDRTRLPFMDIHQAGTRDDRYLYAYAQNDSSAWRYLDNKYRFDYVLVFTTQAPIDHLIEFLGADRAHWALVFSDDAGTLFLRRDGPLAPIARTTEYQVLPAGTAGLRIMAACRSDTLLRRRLETELKRAEHASPWNSIAKSIHAPLLLMDGRNAEALRILGEAIRENPGALNLRGVRAQLELALGDPRAALQDFRGEMKIQRASDLLARQMGIVYSRLGDPGRARAWYRRALKKDPADQVARDSLAALEARARH